jgi:diguanylate cyclase (GGDEF)-like protein/PAS domain S-box-containing protein
LLFRLPSRPNRSRPAAAGRLTRRILLAIVALQVLGIAVVTALLLVAAAGQDRVAAAASRRAVESAITSLQRRVLGMVTDSAFWDEAVDNIHVRINREWIDAYYNLAYADSMEIDDILAVGPDGRPSFVFCRDEAAGDALKLTGGAHILPLVAAARESREGPPSATGFTLIGGAVHWAAASRLRYVDEDRSPAPAESSYLIYARHLGDAGLAAISEDHALEPLTMLIGPPEALPSPRQGEERLTIHAFGSGQAIGAIAWLPERPGVQLLKRAAPVAALAVALMLSLLLVIAVSARRAGRALDRTAAQLATARNTLEAKVAERTQALLAAEARLRGIFDHAAEGIFQLTDDGRYIGVNPAMASIFGYASVEAFLAHAPDHTRQDGDKRGEFVRLIQTFGKVSDFTARARRQDGEQIWISQNARLVHQDDGQVFYEGMLSDITHRKRIEEQLVHDALHDPLTSLPNRKLFEERLAQALARAAGGGGSEPAVLLVDLDRFKLINDSLGHAAGDELLIVMAQRLSHCLRRADTLARLGGDEFAVLTENGRGDGCLALAQRLQDACRRPFLLRGREVYVSLSIGAAVADRRTDPAFAPLEPSELVRNADIAMYQAKARGRGLSVAFTSDMHTSVINRLRVESELRQALANDELVVVYQPIVALDGCTLAGFEALVRWQHPERGLIAPVDFIAIAEESRLIQPLGEVVLRKAAEDMAAWIEAESVPPEMFVSVNLSPLQLEGEDLVERVAGILGQAGLPPHRLKLEITETAMMSNPIDVRAKLKALDALGIRLCIDDFGTGYSSLSQLYSYPFDTLKIDRSFISKLTSSEDGMALVRSILHLAENLRLAVVAEGVEDPAQKEWLRSQGCTFAQGYLFARPLPAEAATRLLHDSLAAAAAARTAG